MIENKLKNSSNSEFFVNKPRTIKIEAKTFGRKNGLQTVAQKKPSNSDKK